jgi:hypothetical protein
VRHEHRSAAGDDAPLRGGVGIRGVLPKPSIKFFRIAPGLSRRGQQERKRVDVVEFPLVAVDLQERGCHGHRDTFFSIPERTLPESGRCNTRSGAGPEPIPTQQHPGYLRSLRTARSLWHERPPSLRVSDIGSLSEALQQFRRLGDELVGGSEERRFRLERGRPPLQIVDELPLRILLLRRQRQSQHTARALARWRQALYLPAPKMP